jgi:RNA polymerase sigma-70 factor (ECF subfamily)
MSNHYAEIDRLLRCHHTDDPIIIEEIINHCYAVVYRVAVSILRDPDEAQDATQDTFIILMTKLDQYHIGTNFKAWLYTVAVNTCRGYLRKRRTRESLMRLLMPLQALVDRPPNPEQSALQSETRSDLWAAVDQLGEKHRMTIILRIEHGLSVKEIAQVLGVREKTVYSRLYDAFRKLRHKLDGQVELESIANWQPTLNGH